MGRSPSPFDASDIEPKWRDFWEDNRFFRADVTSAKPPYSVVLPPPNVTGYLHMGHALVDTLQDALVRYHRMLGFEALWLPGLDHAGISTQAVVERHLWETEQKRRTDLSRDEFLQHAHQWKDKYQMGILSQLGQLGCSCDWSRLKFTLDEDSTLAVKTMFKKLYSEGLIYRGHYLVNWDPVLGTAISDDEVEHEEQDSHLWHFRYPLEDSEEYITIATTRPETVLGDTAVAVHPKDVRYKNWIGKYVLLPLVNRRIPIIADEYVDAEWGTGAVKITPAHDPNDYAIAERHNLPKINIMNADGTINQEGGTFQGQSMRDARHEVVNALTRLKLVEKIEPHKHRVGLSYRSRAPIEPYLSEQWFIKMGPFKDKLLEAVESGRVELIPPEWMKTYRHWIENLQDWCISRQLWWGHQIPIWYHTNGDILCYEKEGVPPQVAEDPDNWHQDADVLDTWFSSALWPLTMLGWPQATPTFHRFYPTNVLVTGHDILFFWVARMIMMGEYATNDVPFKQAFIHGLIYGKSYWREDEVGNIEYVSEKERRSFEEGDPLPPDVQSKWEKMSKSKKNVIDPVTMMKEFGTDAVRFTLVSVTTRAAQIDLDLRRFAESRNFMNKIWNAAGFVLQHLPDVSDLQALPFDTLALEDRWILARLNETIESLETDYKEYTFDRLAHTLYSFFWDTFCAYYLELCKPYLFDKLGTKRDKAIKTRILLIVLTSCILLLHPITPFITEEIFARIKDALPNVRENKDTDILTQRLLLQLESAAVCIAPAPTPFELSYSYKDTLDSFSFLQKAIHAIRNIRGEMNLAPSQATPLYILSEDEASLAFMETHKHIISSLIPLQECTIQNRLDKEMPFASSAILGPLTLLIPLDQELRDREKSRLHKELLSYEKQIEVFTKKLDNKQFIERAPEKLVQETRDKLHTFCEERAKLETKIQQL